ncbi:MAG: nucleotidyltransferase family protein [Chitinophagaceae bacterium]|nr:nucleotidyltransferase family protein [Chitinophagaceae bacterium]
MKIIIPVAGAGTMLRPHTYTQPKPLIPLAGKTIISHIIDQFVELGQHEFIFVIGYLGEKIKNYILEKHPEINAKFVVQEERLGTGHAIFLAKEFVEKNEEIFIIYGDTIIDYPIKEIIDNPISQIGVKKVDDPRMFGVAILNEHKKLVQLVEKPTIPKSNLALVGVYKIIESEALFEVIENDLKKVSKHEEYPLTAAFQGLLNKNISIEVFEVNDWFDCGKKENLLITNAILLDKLEYASSEIPFFDNTIIVHPVSIAEGCDISNSIIGPHVSIGEKTVISNSIISNSIIGSYSEIEKIVFQSSLIGSDAKIKGNNQSLNIGDNTEIDLR